MFHSSAKSDGGGVPFIRSVLFFRSGDLWSPRKTLGKRGDREVTATNDSNLQKIDQQRRGLTPLVEMSGLDRRHARLIFLPRARGELPIAQWCPQLRQVGDRHLRISHYLIGGLGAWLGCFRQGCGVQPQITRINADFLKAAPWRKHPCLQAHLTSPKS